jgi:hypothetical protein
MAETLKEFKLSTLKDKHVLKAFCEHLIQNKYRKL